MSDSARMRKPIKDQTPSFDKTGVESHRTTTTTSSSGKQQSDSEKMRKPIKDQTPSFGRAGVESHLNNSSIFRQQTTNRFRKNEETN